MPLQHSGGPCHTVFGYLPYWMSPQHIQWDRLTHVACFSLEINSAGQIANSHGWPWTNVINDAHANGVKVIPVITLFSGSALSSLLTSPAAKQTLFEGIRDAIIAANAAGVNIDFEGSNATGWVAHMPQFLAELRAYLDAEVPGSEITLAGPAVNWSGAWDLPAVAQIVDGIYIMAYDFYGSWSATSGPSAPLTGGSINVTDTVLAQYGAVLETMPEKLILGVPYYGNQWATQSGAAYSPVVNWINALTYNGAMNQAETHGTSWDGASQTPWTVWHDGINWRQVWFDNVASLALKYDLALLENLQGVGMWALGYDAARPELWDLLGKMFVDDCPAPGIPGDLTGDGTVGVDDLLILLAAWGDCPDCADCPADLTGDCAIGVDDLLILLSNWD